MPDLRPIPVIEYAVWDGRRLFLPYPGGHSTGSKEAADHIVNPNKHLGWRTVECRLVPHDLIFEDDNV